MYEIIRHTPRPKYIRDMAQQVSSSLFDSQRSEVTDLV